MVSDFFLSETALSIWAKTNFWHSAPPEDVNKQWLPLAVHMADSGEVAELIWDNYLSPRQRKLLVEPLPRVETIEQSSRNALSLVKLIVGAHDIGKCSPMFLTQNTELYERIFENGDDSLTKYQRADELRGNSPHSWIGEIAFERWLESRWNPDIQSKRSVKQLGSIIGAHHGRPVSQQRHRYMENPNLPGEVSGDDSWRRIRRELLEWWMNWTGSQEIVDQCQGLIFPTTWQSLVAGITVMADWIASNQELFPLVDWNELYPKRLLSPDHHRDRTKAAWEKLHLPPSWQPEILSQDPDELLQTLFALDADAHARPAQVAAVEAAEKMTLPGMMIIEEVMGAGKTEAALMAATILAKRAGTSGVLVALPTKATTDAMFSRVVEWAQTSAKSGFSLKLQHGNAALNSVYKKIQYGRIASAGNAVSPGQSSSMGIDEESTYNRQSAVVHRWFNKKAALLASVVVCTVDHLLFSALQTKHVSLRHLGISDKVVIIDEVHSYDVYTSQFLKRTVQWLGAFGVPVIALSATLTRRAREELFAAYEKGQELKQAAKEKDKVFEPFDSSVFPAMRKPVVVGGNQVAAQAKGEGAGSSSQTPIYPALSYSDGPGVQVRPLPVLTTKEIEVEHWEGEAGLVADLQTRLQNGGCALVVRNTVANAQRTYETLRTVFGEDVRLVHSRFTQQDRQDNDEWLVRTFGKPGKSRRPKRAIVVGTQVVEQSLDIDFDVLYSDLAPIDLVFQRMGRVHRHQRDARPHLVSHPRCILMGIPTKGSSKPQVDRGSTYVYDEDVLLRTAAYVLDNLKGPMQSWGTSSRFTKRRTSSEPSKSGIIGLLAAAQGRRRVDPVEDLVDLKMAVRIDQPGTRERDFHTTHSFDGETSYPLSDRYYLADAVFVVGLSGETSLIEALNDALVKPKFPLYLGRRAFPPMTPIRPKLSEGNLVDELAAYPWQAAAWYQKKISRKTDWSSSSPLDLENGKVSLEVVADLDLLPAERREDCIFDQVHDVPLSFDSHHRQYEWRDVVRWKCEVATDMAAAETEPSFLTTHNPGGMW